METEKKRIEYTNGEIVVVWQPHLLFRADNAAQMLVGKVFGRQIDEFSIHGRLFNGMSGRHALR